MREIKYNEKNLSYSLHSDRLIYTYDGITHDAVEKLSPELHTKITSFVREQDAEFREMEAKKQAAETQIKIDELNKSVQVFREKLEKNTDIIASGLILEVRDANKSNYYNFKRSLTLKTANQTYSSDEIEYDSTVWRGDSWRPEKTDRVWKLSFDYKTTRYSDLDKAVKKYIEKIHEKQAERVRKTTAENLQNTKHATMEKYCLENGLIFDKNWHSYGTQYHRSDGGYYNYSGRKDGVSLSLTCNDELIVTVTSITIGKPTPEFITKVLNGEHK